MKTRYTITILSLIVLGCSFNLQKDAPETIRSPHLVINQEPPLLELKVLTCNTGDLSGHKRLDTPELADFLKSCGELDIMFLQEIRGEREAKAISEKIGMKYNIFVSEPKERNGIAILSRLRLLNQDVLNFEGNKRAGALSANIILNGYKVQLVNVHLDRDRRVQSKNGVVDFNIGSALQFLKDEMSVDNVRSRAVRELIEWLERKKNSYIILGGDFNTIPQSKSIKIMETMFNDALCPSLTYFQGTYTRINAPFPVRIDYLFHTPSLRRLEADIIHKSPGDHYPIIGRFSVSPP